LKTCEFTKRTLEASVMKLEQEAGQLLKTISELQSTLEGLQSEVRRGEKAQELARMSREDSDATLATALSEVRMECCTKAFGFCCLTTLVPLEPVQLAAAKQARSHAEEQAKLALSRAEELAGVVYSVLGGFLHRCLFAETPLFHCCCGFAGVGESAESHFPFGYGSCHRYT
jgi:hypothetical protein